MALLVIIAVNFFYMKPGDSAPVVTPEDGVVTGNHIPAYTNTWEMTAVFPDGSVEYRGKWDDEVSFYYQGETEILKRVQHVYYQNKTSVQEEEVFRNNLKHYRLIIRTEDEEPHTDIYYEGNRIWGKKIFRAEGLDTIEQLSVPFSYDLPQSVFDWHLWGILIAGFPLKKGYRARFLAHESYSSHPGDFRWFTLKVTGQEMIDGGKWGRVNCWTVDVDDKVRWKLWIAVRKDIASVQQICIFDTGGKQLWWKPEKK